MTDNLYVNTDNELLGYLDVETDSTGRIMTTTVDLDGRKRKFLSDSLKPVPQNMIDYFLNNSFKRQFKGAYITRGQDYYKKGKVSNVRYMPDQQRITGKIAGTNIYTAVIKIEGMIMTNVCTCPVRSGCKHVAALSFKVQSDFETIRSAADNTPTVDQAVKMARELCKSSGFKAAIELLLGYYANPERIEYVTTELLDAARECPLEYAKILEKYADTDRKPFEKKAILKAAVSLEGSGYFISLLESLMDRYDYGGYTHVTEKELDVKYVDPKVCEEFFRYYKPGFRLRKNQERIETWTSLTSPLGREIVYFQAMCDGFSVVRTQGIGDLTPTEAAGYLYWYVKEKMKDEYEESVNSFKAEIEEEKQARITEGLRRRIDSFALAVNSAPRTVLSKEKAKVDFEFEFNAGGSELELRIGLKKKYVVKSIPEFAGRFENNETFKYGKEFTFTHNIENIVPEQREALKKVFIAASGYESQYTYRNGRYINLPGSLTDELFLALKDQKVLINNREMYLSLEKIPARITMNKSCILTIETDANDFSTLVTSGRIYLMDHEREEVRLLSDDYNEAMLYNFVMNNQGLSMEPVMDKFRDEVYARFYTKIDIADSLKERLKLSQLDIRAYFDYIRSGITVKYGFFRDEVEVAEDSLTSTLDRRKADDFLNYLALIGFEDGIITDEGQVLNFFLMDMTELKKYAEVYLSETIQNKSIHNFKTQNIRIQYDNSMMDAFLEDSDYSDKELKEILKAIRHKKKFILLAGDRIINLDNEDAGEFERTVSELRLNEDKLSEPTQLPVPQALRALAHEKGCKIDDYLYNMIDDIRRFKKSPEPLPNVNATLRPYQEEGFLWLKTLSNYHVGGILADDMGLGKTLEIITLLKSDPTKIPSLVVCPKSVVFNWVNEFERFDPEAEVIGVYGNAGDRHMLIGQIDKNKKICMVTSYDSLRQDEEYYDFPLKYMVLDEAQYIKNVNAQKSKAAKSLKADIRLALTGTPIENNVIDLWSIFDFIMPGYLDELTAFRHSYNGNEKYTQAIAKKIAPFILRRTKREVLKDLPEKYERIVSAEMVPEQRKVYDAYKLEAREALESGNSAFEVLPYLMRLRQICDDPSMFAQNYHGGSGKINALKEILDEYLDEGHRILIFSQFVKAIEQIEELLRNKNIEYDMITGKTSSQDRIRIMHEFNAGAGGDVLLISLKAGGTGLNLTGADTVIHFDPWWNTAAEDQASDRAHRIGQTRNVEVIKLICENSVEQKVIELQNTKKDIIDKLISNSDKSVTGISIEDVKFILRDF